MVSQELFNPRRCPIYGEIISTRRCSYPVVLLTDIKLFRILKASGGTSSFWVGELLATVKDNRETGRACSDENKYCLAPLFRVREGRGTHAVFRLQTQRIVVCIREEARESQANWSRGVSHVLGAKLDNSVYDDKNANTREIVWIWNSSEPTDPSVRNKGGRMRANRNSRNSFVIPTYFERSSTLAW